MPQLLIFCEARADFETVAGLVDRVLREEAPSWITDLLDGPAEGAATVRSWVSGPGGQPFFDLHHVKDYARQLGVRVPYGHFDGSPGASGALMARNVFLVAREIARRSLPVDAVLLVWDMDDQGDARRQGLAQARNEAVCWAGFAIILGCPERMREAWVLAGFYPEIESEQTTLDAERQSLGFCPCAKAHCLDAKDEQAKRNPKRVLAALTGGDRDPEARCWTAASLPVRRARGEGSGLHAFLDEVAQTLIPLLTRASDA